MPKHRKIIICPECEGEKIKMYCNEIDEREEKPCDTCGGEGMVIQITEITIKKLKDA